MLGVRARPGAPEQKEPSLPLQPPAGPDDTLVVARWADGSSHPLPGLTKLRLSELQGAPIVRTLWESRHAESGNRIWIDQRVDRQLLLSMYEQGKQRLQLSVNLFGNVPNERQSPDHPAIKAALNIMVIVAEKFSKHLLS